MAEVTRDMLYKQLQQRIDSAAGIEDLKHILRTLVELALPPEEKPCVEPQSWRSLV